MFVLPSSQNFNISLTDARLPNGLNKIDQNKISLYTNNQSRFTLDSVGKIGINLDNPLYILDINDTGAIRFPRGTTAQRPSGVNGLLRYNTDENKFEGYANGQWGSIGGGGGAIDTDEDTFIRAENPEGADNDELEFYTGGVERMNIGVSGNVIIGGGDVGIGITPIQNLHIHESSSGLNYLHFSNTDTGTTSNDGFDIGIDASEVPIVWNRENTDMKFGTNNAERMRILASGNIGIGTSNPAANGTINLHIHSSDSSGAWTTYTNSTTGTTTSDGFIIGINSSEEAKIINLENTDMSFSTNNTERMRILSTGEVGIGTNNPTSLLEVRQDQNATTQIRAYNNTNDTTAFTELRADSNGGRIRMMSFPPGYTTNGALIPDSCILASENHTQLSIINLDGTIKWYTTNTGGWTSATERMSLGSTGTLTMKTTLHIDQGQLLTAGTNNTLYVDTTNNEVGIGTNAPVYELDVVIDQNAGTEQRIFNNTNDTAAFSGLRIQSNTGQVVLRNFSSTFTTNGINIPNTAGLVAFDLAQLNIGNLDGSINWYTTTTGSAGSAVERMSLGGAGTLTMKTTLHIDQGQLLTAGTNNTLYVDTTNNRVGIGTNNPSQLLDVRLDQNASTVSRIYNATSGTSGNAYLNVRSSGGQLQLRSFSQGYTTSGMLIADSGALISYDHPTFNFGNVDGSISWWTTNTGSTASAVERMVLGSNGTLTMKTTLHIDQGQLLTAGTNNTLYVDTTNNEVGIGTNAPAVRLDVRGDENALTTLQVRNLDSDTSAGARMMVQANGTSVLALYAFSPSYTTSGAAIADGFLIWGENEASAGLNIGSGSSAGLRFWTANNAAISSAVERMVLGSNGTLTMKTTLHIDQGQLLTAGTNNTLYIDTTNY